MADLLSVGAVAEGALIYAQRPLTEPQIARTNIGLQYLEDRHPDGLELPHGEVRPAIGWVIQEVDIPLSRNGIACSIIVSRTRKRARTPMLFS